jgi:hypothetical protein
MGKYGGAARVDTRAGVESMAYTLPGISSDELPQVLAAGVTDAAWIFMSMSAREPNGRDVEYLQWHSLDHRPEQYRVAGLRHSIRLVSTPACRSARAFSDERYTAVDHVMIYFFSADAAFEQFTALSAALGGARRPFRLPSVNANYFKLAGKLAARSAIAGADVIPWRPALGIYLLVEQGAVSPESLVEVDGIAGTWWHLGGAAPVSGFPDASGVQVTCLFLDQDPVQTAARLRGPLMHRWQSGVASPLLAAPFHCLAAFEWERYLP